MFPAQQKTYTKSAQREQKCLSMWPAPPSDDRTQALAAVWAEAVDAHFGEPFTRPAH